MRGTPPFPNWTAGGGINRNTPYRVFDDFMGGVLAPPWVYVAGTLSWPDFERGEIKLAADAGTATKFSTSQNSFYRAANPCFEVRLMTTTVAKGHEIVFNHTGAGGHYVFGVTFQPATDVHFRMVTRNNGGATVYTASTTTVVVSTWYTIKCWIGGPVGAQTHYMTIDGGDLVTDGSVPDPGLFALHVWQDNLAGAGEGLYLDWIGVEANFGATPA